MATDKKLKRTELLKGVVMDRYQERDSDGKLYYYIKITLDIFETLEFAVDFSESRNVYADDSEGMVKRSFLKPHSEQVVAKLRLEKDWNLKTKFKFNYSVPDLPTQREALAKPLEAHAAAVKRAYLVPEIRFPFTEEKYRAYLANMQQPFVDTAFEPTAKSLGFSDQEMEQSLGVIVHWRRGGGGLRKTPVEAVELFSGDGSWALDLKVGKKSHFAFASVLAALAENPKVVCRLFLSKKVEPKGIYRLKLCLGGTWRELVVDDCFPCLPFSEPLFSSNNSDALWVALVEKALAKASGGYKAMSEVSVERVFAELTGCPVSSHAVSDLKGRVWALMKESKERGWTVLAKLHDVNFDGSELERKDFCYTVLNVAEYKGVRLIEIRNQWNAFDWEGAWSAKSPQWTNEAVQALGYDREDSNILWINEADFTDNFSRVWISCVSRWEELRAPGKFVTSAADQSSRERFSSRWAYRIHVTKASKVVIGVHQLGGVGAAGRVVNPPIDVGLAVLQGEGETMKLLHLLEPDCDKDAFLDANLPEGDFTVLPLSAGVLMKPEMFRTKKAFDITKGELLTAALEDLFRKLDVKATNYVGEAELKGFFALIGDTKGDAQIQEALSRFAAKDTRQLTLDGFVRFFEETFLSKSQVELVQIFEKLGYKANLFSFRSRPFTLSFHSDFRIEMTIVDALATRLDDQVNCLLIREKGQAREERNGGPLKLLVRTNPNLQIRSYAVKNDSFKPARFTLSFDAAQNAEVSGRERKISGKVKPGETEFVCHTQPVDPKEHSDDGVALNFLA